MKHLFLILLLLGCQLSTMAEPTGKDYSNPTTTETQRYILALKVTVNSVAVRTGPGSNYPVKYYDGRPFCLEKGEIVMPSEKQKKNGYILFFYHNNEYYNGWIPANCVKEVPWDDGYGEGRNRDSYVYADSYDGFVNIRSQPKAGSSIMGKLVNGGTGIVYLGNRGNWYIVSYYGKVGFVDSRYAYIR